MRVCVIAPKDEVEDDEGQDDAEDTGEGKIQPLLHQEEREQAFQDLVETRSMASRGQSKTPLNEARQTITQQGRERKYQTRFQIKTFDPCAGDRDRDRKEEASPGF